MNILGIFAFGMNPAACLLKDGECVAFAEEERFTRIKVSEGMFPVKALTYCLASRGLTLGSLDRIAFGWDVTKYPWKMMRNFGANYLKYGRAQRHCFHKTKNNSSFFLITEGLTDFHHLKVRAKILEGLRQSGLKGDIPKIEFVPHHLAHAYSAYFCSDFKKAGILTIDGHGEEICTQLAIADEDDIRIVETISIPHSLGWFYAAITEYLGFIPYRDEGKLMGLAAYGKTKENNKWIEPLSRILEIKDCSYEVNPVYTLFGSHYYGKRYTDELVKLITSVDPRAEPIYYGEKVIIDGRVQSKYLLDTYADIAYTAQELLERAAVMLGRRLVQNYKVENLCIAGGVGLNCKMNGEILRKSGCKNIFVQPAANDAGVALGAAIYVSKKMGENVRGSLKNVYLGPEFTSTEINTVLKNCKLDFKEVDDPANEAAKLLEEGSIIAWFQGRMEFGARALGNRSILANPVFLGIKDKVNNEVKYRESWRPFCPSLIADTRDRYITDANETSFMTVAYHMQEPMREKLKPVVHVDGTVRPQTVTRETNPLFYALISNLEKRIGHPIVLNTSFNIRGEPIVCTPLDAVRCFYSNGLDALIIGNFMLKKK